jgi:hypothetical protein
VSVGIFFAVKRCEINPSIPRQPSLRASRALLDSVPSSSRFGRRTGAATAQEPLLPRHSRPPREMHTMNHITDTCANLAAIVMSVVASAPARLLGSLMLAAALLIGLHAGLRHVVADQAATSAQIAQIAR